MTFPSFWSNPTVRCTLYKLVSIVTVGLGLMALTGWFSYNFGFKAIFNPTYSDENTDSGFSSFDLDDLGPSFYGQGGKRPNLPFPADPNQSTTNSNATTKSSITTTQPQMVILSNYTQNQSDSDFIMLQNRVQNNTIINGINQMANQTFSSYDLLGYKKTVFPIHLQEYFCKIVNSDQTLVSLYLTIKFEYYNQEFFVFDYQNSSWDSKIVYF